jgi:hypothetical protein
MHKIILAGAFVMAATACGSSSNPSPSAATTPEAGGTTAAAAPTQAEMAATYLRLVKPANEAITKFQSSELDDNASAADAQKVADPLIAAYRKTDEELLRAAWTPAVYVDIKSVVTADRQLEAVLGTIGDQNDLSVTAWLQQVSQAGAAASSAVSIVRADLGLPPAK